MFSTSGKTFVWESSKDAESQHITCHNMKQPRKVDLYQRFHKVDIAGMEF